MLSPSGRHLSVTCPPVLGVLGLLSPVPPVALALSCPRTHREHGGLLTGTFIENYIVLGTNHKNNSAGLVSVILQ